MSPDARDYAAFEAAFPFEETHDQPAAIRAVLADLATAKPMDRVVCGDVGFGKTEVAMRAAFAAVQAGRQVAVLVPTTLLAQQHYQSFTDRFADWPVRIESLSRFRTGKEAKAVIEGIAAGAVDIVIATPPPAAGQVRFQRPGAGVIDEEHRFGVRDKERLKALRTDVDVLTLTATPIPRTFNMALGGLSDLSPITTPPAERLAVKTFVLEWNEAIVREAITARDPPRRPDLLRPQCDRVDREDRAAGSRSWCRRRTCASATARCASATSSGSCSISIIGGSTCWSAPRSSKAASTCPPPTPSSSIAPIASGSRKFTSCAGAWADRTIGLMPI